MKKEIEKNFKIELRENIYKMIFLYIDYFGNDDYINYEINDETGLPDFSIKGE